jgi:ABC-type phosphate transport system permease subunit
MAVFWYLIGLLAFVIAIITIFDLVRSHAHSGLGTAGWIAAIIILPLIGSIAYWATRKTPGDEVEAQRLGEQAMRQEHAHRSVDSPSIRP